MALIGAFDYGCNDMHNNMMPYPALDHCIAPQGVFPPRP
jgi:microcystin-dependent protein